MPLTWLENGILASMNGNTPQPTGDLTRIMGLTQDVGITTHMNGLGFWISEITRPLFET